MKCPKCGFNSFESNDACPKCAVSLKELKQTYGLAPVVFSSDYRRTLVSEYGAGQSATHAGGGEGSEFAFESPAGQHGQQRDEPSASSFSFDDAAQEGAGGSSSPPQDPFAELLETSPQPIKAEAQQPAAPFPDQGYELSSFSWGDAPEPAAADAESPQADAPVKEEDDFASLFGDLGDTKK